MNEFKAFLEVVSKFTDLKWGDVRDDLISRSIKVLRKYREGKTPEDLKNSKLILGIEDFYEKLYEIYKENPQSIEKLTEALSSFIKAPVPCKLKIINIVETLLKE
ncbi:hypothetical protein [Aquifex aeolicus]|uniref:hypothetical protein n=1 Tax=Aquifex aeolicus TaxID=63363 RepID=UPI00030FB936|nr:hypothetical protein [Aquifex aeolicus]